MSVIIAAAQHFLSGWMQEDCVLVLCNVTAGNVIEWRVRCNNSRVNQLLERCKMSRPCGLKPSTTKGQCMEFVFDFLEQGLRLRITDRNITTILIDHVMTAIRCVENHAFTGRTERFNSKQLALLHFCFSATFHDWDTLTSMNCVWTN